MAKAPRPGEVKTRLAAAVGAEAAAAFYARSLEDTVALAARVCDRREGLTVVLSYAPAGVAAELRALAGAAPRLVAQRDGDLGARLAGCFEELFAEGFGAVAAIGADSPTVPVDYLERAFAALEGGADTVIGPSRDGGYYLVGLGRFEPLLFEGVPWSTERVYAETASRARKAGLTLAELPEWYDVDEAADLERLREDLARDPAAAPRTREWLQEHLRG